MGLLGVIPLCQFIPQTFRNLVIDRLLASRRHIVLDYLRELNTSMKRQDEHIALQIKVNIDYGTQVPKSLTTVR